LSIRIVWIGLNVVLEEFYYFFCRLLFHVCIGTNGQGLLLRWYSMFLSPERLPSSEPKAEGKYKSRAKNVTPGTTDEQRTKS
jgi:hypothetical protein